LAFRSLAEQWEYEVEEGHLMPDHVHMLLSVPPKCSVSNVMGFYQGEERDSYCADVCGTAKELCRPAFLGAELLGINGRQKRGCRALVSKSRKRKTNASNNWNWWRFERLPF
jgi:REP element-mobilizing transposase RayT